ncbi:MAG: aspartate-semialdehyde dehydrogenase [Clostridia bacterium]|nr:aspartate-semialdehyde dehydrogenase [Clostridia bacterium]
MREYKLALVGATGVVGREARLVLEELKLPISKYVFFASSRSAGTKIEFMGKEYEIQELKEDSFDEGFDFAVFSAGGETSKKFGPIASTKGAIVVDNSSAFRMDEDVPLVVPEVNPEDIAWNHGIIANPNCSTIQAVVPLKVLDDKYKIKRIIYATYQAVSGAGKSGIDDLENGIKGYVDGEEYELTKFANPIFNNCLPDIDIAMSSGYTKEEEKMMNETRKILGRPDLAVTATCVRVPVFNSHSEAINVEFEKEFDLEELVETLKNAEGIIVQDDLENHIYPLAANATGHNEVFVGRIRRDNSVKNGLNFWCVADNIRKGAATNALQIVKYIIENN